MRSRRYAARRRAGAEPLARRLVARHPQWPDRVVREVEETERVDRWPDADVAGLEGVRGLREKEVEQVAQHSRRRLRIDRSADERADVGDDDARRARFTGDADGNIRRQAAIDQHMLIDDDWREDNRDRRA